MSSTTPAHTPKQKQGLAGLKTPTASKKKSSLDGTPRAQVVGSGNSLAAEIARERQTPAKAATTTASHASQSHTEPQTQSQSQTSLISVLAPKISIQTPQGKQKAKSRGGVFKTYLDTPFKVVLPIAGEASAAIILQLMESLRPLVHRDIKSFHKQSKRAAAAAAQLSTATPLSTATTTTTSTPITPADPQHQFTRDVFALGINEVTRALEQDGAQLVLVCASIHPPHVVLHLPTLCALRKTRVCAIPDLSHHMATLFGLKHVAALAFRRTLLCDQQHHEMLKGVITRMASLMTVPALPWLPTAATSTSSSTTEPTTPTTGVDAITMDRRRKAPDITYLSARVKRMKAEPQSKTPPKPASVKS